MSLQNDHQHLNDILEATHAAAFEFLESLATRPAGRTPEGLPHDVLPEEGLGAQRALKEDGRVLLTPTFFAGKPAIRAAFVNWSTSEGDILLMLKALEWCAKAIDCL
jgi:hypothetical protein